MSDRIKTIPDAPWRPAGAGKHVTFRCLGCDKGRVSFGSRGVGIRKRCADCVAKRNQ